MSRVLVYSIVFWAVIEALIAVLQYCHIIDNGHELFRITGTFSNPSQLGCLLALSFVILSDWITTNRTYFYQIIVILVLLLLALAMLLTSSRAAILAAILGCFYIIYTKQRIKSPRLLLFMTLFIILSGIVLFFVRPSSALGRLLIWYISLGMFCDSPLCGFGTYGFQKNYMLYQAEFMKNSSNSFWPGYADNVAFPYNEYLHILIDYGIIGLIIAVYIIITVLKTDSVNSSAFQLKSALISFCVFAFFSYPLYTYRLFLLFCLICLSLIVIRWHMAKRGMICILILVALICVGTYNAVKEYVLETKVKSSDIILSGDNLKELERYPFVMDIYIQSLTDDSEVLIADRICPSTYLYCRIGDFMCDVGDYKEAQYYYSEASHMVPKLLTPKYKLFMLLYDIEQYNEAYSLGCEMLATYYPKRGTELLRMLAKIEEKMKLLNNNIDDI